MTDLVVYVVDDEPSIRTALRRLLGAADLACEAFGSPQEFLDHLHPDAAGCLVLDVEMPQLNGLDLQQALSQRGSILPIVFLTGHGDVPTSVRAMKQGALDFLTKPVDQAALLGAILGGFERCRALRRARAELLEIERRLARLTPRECDVLKHVVAGLLNKQIASALGTVEKTIKVHRARVMRKMQADSLADLVRLVERAGVFGKDPGSSRA